MKTTLRDSAAMRWTVLLFLAFAMFCSYIFMDILSPIKDLMQSTRGWDSTAFGTMQGSETFLNVFVFFLIFAGIILDKMGVRFTAVLSGVVMLVGAVINWYAVTTAFAGSDLETWFNNNLNYIPVFDELGISPFYRGMPASAKLSAVGFMIFGCGVEMAGITVSRGIVKWFKGREMALAMGSEMALARLGVATCMIFSPVFAKLGGVIDVSRSVAFGVVLLMIALIMFIVYFFMDKKLDAQTGEAEEKDDPFKISDLGTILKSSGFWLVALLCVLYYSAILPFQKYAVNMLQCNLTFTEVSPDSFWATNTVTIIQYCIMLVVAAAAFASNFSKVEDIVAECAVEVGEEVPSLVVKTEVEAHHQVRIGVADIFLVVVVELTVVVKVEEADIAGLCVRLDELAVLVGVGIDLFPVLEKTVCLIAIEARDETAVFVADDALRHTLACPYRTVAGEFYGFVAHSGELHAEVIAEVAHLVVPAQREFPTASTHLADVLCHCAHP